MGTSKIEWTEATWNPIAGCSKVSSGCANCYAERMSQRLAAMGQTKYRGVVDDRGHWTGKVNFDEAELLKPLKRRKPTMYFVCSMSDLFQEAVPFAFIDKVFAVMALCSQHTFQVLTKRPERMSRYFAGDGGTSGVELRIMRAMEPLVGKQGAYKGQGRTSWLAETERVLPLPNVWLGTSVENQECADKRIPHLIECPAAVRFLSCEPLLGPIDIQGTTPVGRNVDWVIVGGESGPGARPMNLDWARDIRDTCVEAGVPFFFKQVGGVNKNAAGRLLDGREWNEMPKGGA